MRSMLVRLLSSNNHSSSQVQKYFHFAKCVIMSKQKLSFLLFRNIRFMLATKCPLLLASIQFILSSFHQDQQPTHNHIFTTTALVKLHDNILSIFDATIWVGTALSARLPRIAWIVSTGCLNHPSLLLVLKNARSIKKYITPFCLLRNISNQIGISIFN